jgi:uncharacterized coiled-coil DUF342 family protein
MGTMREMAEEYREAAAKINMRIHEKKAAGASEEELKELRQVLRDIRDAQRLLSGYYDVPRDGKLTFVGIKPRRTRDDH